MPIYENSPVNTWRRAGRLHELLTPRGVVRAKKVVIATNGYTPDGLHPMVRGRLMNVLSNIVVTAPLSEGSWPPRAGKTHKMVVDTRNLRSYFRLLEDNRIMFGARGGISDTAANRSNDEGLAADPAREAVSGLGAIGADYFWQGWVAIPRDKGPHIHVADNGSVAIGWAVRERGSPCRRTRANCWPTASRPNAGRTYPPSWALHCRVMKSPHCASCTSARPIPTFI